ncbi:ATP-binding protein [Kitasatospora sp. NPDC059646]|uniref:ATP-binding protein n=1 Tax=Kitasatospora sp. NPDC059646 TaxID=3346893 RepID=UPI0036CD853A
MGSFPALPLDEDELADGTAAFAPLPAVADATRALATALDRAGAPPGGEPLLDCTRAEFTARWDGLRRTADPDEPLVVHFCGHGAQSPGGGGLFLATADGQAAADRLFDTCVSFAGLLEAAELSGRPVLFLLDVCGAGRAVVQQQLNDLAARRAQDAPRRVSVVGACADGSLTYGARFTSAAAEVLHRLADGALDLTPTLEFVPVETLAAAIDRLLDGPGGGTVVRTPHAAAAGEPQPFFRNPAHTRDPQAGLLSGMNPRLREFALGCAPGLDPLHFATRAAGNPTVHVVQFSGRTAQLATVTDWLERADDERDNLLVVTGGPGSGKSALLGVATCLLHPELEPLAELVRPVVPQFAPRPPATVLAVHARQLTLRQITDSLRHQLDRQTADGAVRPGPNGGSPGGAGGPAELLRELRAAEDVLIVLDALDEAQDPAEVVAELILPLTGGDPAGGCRLLVGTRPWWDSLPSLAAA